MTPDDKMGEPIEKVCFWAARMVERFDGMLSFHAEEANAELTDEQQRMLDDYLAKEEELRHAYLVVLRARAQEVADYLTRLGMTGATRQFVWDHPFECALIAEQRRDFAI